MLNADVLLDREFLEMRHRALDLAAAFDRIDRADPAGSARDDPRMRMLFEALRVLSDGQPDRAERVQLAFSKPYDQGWRTA